MADATNENPDAAVLDGGSGNGYEISHAHDVRVIGAERCVGFEFESRAAEEYPRDSLG